MVLRTEEAIKSSNKNILISNC